METVPSNCRGPSFCLINYEIKMGSKKVSYAIRCKGNTKISVAVNDFASVTVQH